MKRIYNLSFRAHINGAREPTDRRWQGGSQFSLTEIYSDLLKNMKDAGHCYQSAEIYLLEVNSEGEILEEILLWRQP